MKVEVVYGELEMAAYMGTEGEYDAMVRIGNDSEYVFIPIAELTKMVRTILASQK